MARLRPILPDGRPLELVAGVQKSFGAEILDRDGLPRDIDTDTVTVVAKLDTTDKTLGIAKDTPSTDGRVTITCSATALSGAGTLYVDIRAAESGGEPENVVELEIPVVVALAG